MNSKNRFKLALLICAGALIVIVTIVLMFNNPVQKEVERFSDIYSSAWNVQSIYIKPEEKTISVWFQENNFIKKFFNGSYNVNVRTEQGLRITLETCSIISKTLINNLGNEYADYSIFLRFQDTTKALCINFEANSNGYTKFAANSCYNLSLNMISDYLPELNELNLSPIIIDDMEDFNRFHCLEVIDIWDRDNFTAKDVEYISSLFPNAKIDIAVSESISMTNGN